MDITSYVVYIIHIYLCMCPGTMVLSEYAKIRILTLWRQGFGPTTIADKLNDEDVKTTRKTVSLFISRFG